MKRIIVVLFALILVGCGQGPKNTETVKVKIGLMGSNNKAWEHVKTEALKEGIELEVVVFDAYPIINRELSEGGIDINAFQHYNYLNKEVEELGYDLSVIGETVYAPLGLYSKKIKNISELVDGDKVAIPDDVTNGGRSLLLLEEAGILEIDDAAGNTPTIKDITRKNVNVDIIEIAANIAPNTLDEVTVVAINSGIAIDAGLVPVKDAIVLESVEGDNPFINVIVVKTANKDNVTFKRIVELYQTDDVKRIIEEDTKGSSVPVWK